MGVTTAEAGRPVLPAEEPDSGKGCVWIGCAGKELWASLGAAKSNTGRSIRVGVSF